MVGFGRYHLHLWPIPSCDVTFAHTTHEDYQAAPGRKAFNLQPAWKRIAVMLAGPLFLVGFAVLFLGEAGVEQFTFGLLEIVVGSVTPLSKAQTYLTEFGLYVRSNGMLSVTALLAAKMAALNLLPILPFTGGRIVLALIELKRQTETRTLPIWFLAPLVIICAGWSTAIAFAAWQALF